MVQEKDIVIKGIKTHFLEIRNEKKNTIIMLHGALAAHQMFTPLIKRLSPYFNIFALDEPGFGETEPLPNNVIPEYVEWLHEFITQHKIKKPIFFGMSLGGLISLYFAGTYPDIPEKVIVQAPPTYTESIFPNQLKLFSTARQAFSSDRVKVISERLARSNISSKLLFHLFKISGKDNKEICKHLGEKTVMHLGQHIDTRALSQILTYLLDFSIDEQIKEITCPLLGIIGKEDLTIIPQSIYKIKILNPKAKVLIHNEGGHAMSITHSEIIAQYIINFTNEPSVSYSLGKRVGTVINKIKNLFR